MTLFWIALAVFVIVWPALHTWLDYRKARDAFRAQWGDE